MREGRIVECTLIRSKLGNNSPVRAYICMTVHKQKCDCNEVSAVQQEVWHCMYYMLFTVERR